MEQTLFICREVDIFRIPPRTGRGHISGEWRVEDKIFTARCRVIAQNDNLEVRLEDPSTGEIFGACPVPRGQRDAAVENAVDSSRNFVLRIQDPATGRHAFLGMNFAERSNAFDFNVALTDFEKQLQRQDQLKAAAAGTTTPHQSSSLDGQDAAALYRHEDLTLKEGQSIKIEVKKKTPSTPGEESKGGFLSRLGTPSKTNNNNNSIHLGGVSTHIPPLNKPPIPMDIAAIKNKNNDDNKNVPSSSVVVAQTEDNWATF